MYKELLENIGAIIKLMDQANKHLKDARGMINHLSSWEGTGKEISECEIAQVHEVLGWSSRRFSLGSDCLKVICEDARWGNQ